MMRVKRELHGWSPTDIEWDVYQEWELHKKYPYAGGYLDQPEWFFELRRKCGLFEELIRLNNGLREKKD
jgi:hypothetical protein